MTEMLCRAATRADLEAIVALLADDTLGSGRETTGATLDPAYLAAWEAIERDPNQLLVAAEQAGRVIGTLQISFMPGISLRGAWRGEIEGVRVARDRRGSGLGQQMLRWSVEQCRARGCRVVQLTTNASRTDAQRFYERLGFQRSHVGFKLAV